MSLAVVGTAASSCYAGCLAMTTRVSLNFSYEPSLSPLQAQTRALPAETPSQT